MENQNPEQSAQQAQGNPVNPSEMTTEQRLEMCEHFLAEAMKGYQMAGQAINRLESYTFVLVDLVLKNDVATFDEVKELQEKLIGYDDLLDFWGVQSQEKEKTTASSEG